MGKRYFQSEDATWTGAARLLAAMALVVIAAGPASGLPSFYTQTGFSCDKCHVGGGRPPFDRCTNFGAEFKRNGNKLPRFADFDASTLLQQYDDAIGPETRVSLRNYLRDMQDGAAWLNSLLKADEKRTPVYCVPATKTFDGDELIEIVRREVDRNSASGKQRAGLVMFVGLRRLYPCQ